MIARLLAWLEARLPPPTCSVGAGASRVVKCDLLNPGGAWTLFFTGPRTKDWGFWDRHTQRFFDWRENPEAIP